MRRLCCRALAAVAGLALSLPAALPAADTWLDIEKAQPLAVEDLGEPVRSMRQGGSFTIPKPDGKGWWYVTCYNPLRRNALPNQVYVVDLDTRKVTMRKEMPAGAIISPLNFNEVVGKDGKYYLPFLGTPLGMWSFDPKDGSLKWLPTDVDSMLSFMAMGVAGDGKIYGGSCSKTALLLEYDPATDKYRNFGEIGPHHESPRYVWSLTVADDYVYCAAGKNPWYVVAVDRVSGKQKVLLTGNMDYMECRSAGTIWVRYPAEGDKPAVSRHFRLAKGEMTEFDPLKEPRPAAKPALPRPETHLGLALPTSEGKAQIWWRMPGKEWDFVDLDGIQTIPYKLDCLCAMKDGRLFGSARDYQDCFILDPATKRFTILGKPPVSFGTMEALGDRIYLLGYPGTYVMEYDPSRPWTVGTKTPTRDEPAVTAPESNPRECHRWTVGIMPTHHIRASAIGADGFICFGAHAERAAVGGGLGWWDPAARKPGGLRAPFEMQDCAGMAAARKGKLIVYSSFPVADPTGKTPKPAEGKLFVLDTETKKIVSEIVPLPGMTNCGEIAALGDKVFGVGTTAQGPTFYVVDLAQGKTVFSRPAAKARSPEIGPDGKLYLFADSALVRIDPDDYTAQVLGTVESAARICFLGSDAYFTGSPMLRRIAGLAKAK